MFTMITVGIFEAKACLGQLAQSAAEGEVVVLTRRGKPVAEIRAPEGEFAHADARRTIEALRKLRQRIPAQEFDVAELVAEGRR